MTREQRDALAELTRLSEEMGLYDIPFEEIQETCRRVREEMHEEREAKKLPLIERESRLNQGARDYLQGRISLDEWGRIKRLYGPDYIAAVRTLTQRKEERRQSLLPNEGKSLLSRLKKFAKLFL